MNGKHINAQGEATVMFTQRQLRAALLKWEQQYRAGGTLAQDATNALPPEVVADRSAELMWRLLVHETHEPRPAAEGGK